MKRALLAVVVSVAVLAGTQVSYALLIGTSSAGASYSTAVLSAPAAVNAVRSICTPALNDSAQITWTPPAGNKASSAEILRSTTSGGPYTVVGSVENPTTSYTDGGLAFSTTYYYVVRTAKNQWKSSNSAQTSVTTRNALCL